MLILILIEQFRYMWWPENPQRGSRCRRIYINDEDSDYKIHPAIGTACEESNISPSDFVDCFPKNFCMTIDPDRVIVKCTKNRDICRRVYIRHTEDWGYVFQTHATDF